MKLNNAIFIDIEQGLIKTRSGRPIPLHNLDWVFNDEVISYIKENDYNHIVLVADRKRNQIINKVTYNKFVDLIQDNLYKILKSNVLVLNELKKDEYFNYPFPGAIYNLCIEYNINLAASLYLTSNKDVSNYISINQFIYNPLYL